MLLLKIALWIAGLTLLAMPLGRLGRAWLRRRQGGPSAGGSQVQPAPWPRRTALWRPALFGVAALLLTQSLVLVPAGQAGVRVNALAGPRPSVLRPGLHLVVPLLDEVVHFDTRDQLLSTDEAGLQAQSREGLAVGLAVIVRYRLDPGRLPALYASLPQPVERELVPPVVESVFRDLLPRYLVREVFSEKRDELRQLAAQAITARLGDDGVLVKEVLLRDVKLPAEYAQGLETLLLKQQESERMVFQLAIKEHEVRQAELEAEADKRREVKAAEAQAQVRVLQAKAEADAMQHTLPLKEKQIQQTRLEAEARKEATLMNAEAAGQAKVIDGRAELQRLNLMAEAESHRIRVTAEAELERMKIESIVLKENPLLIQKIVAERLSDKMQIMMVPMDGSNFFATEVFRSAAVGSALGASRR